MKHELNSDDLVLIMQCMFYHIDAEGMKFCKEGSVELLKKLQDMTVAANGRTLRFCSNQQGEVSEDEA